MPPPPNTFLGILYRFSTLCHDSFIVDDETFEADDETEQLKHEKSRDVVKKKPHTIVPLVVRNLHNQAFQTVQDLIKNKIIMDDNSIAPSVLNLLTNHIKGEKIIKEKMSLPALTMKKGKLGGNPVGATRLDGSTIPLSRMNDLLGFVGNRTSRLRDEIHQGQHELTPSDFQTMLGMLDESSNSRLADRLVGSGSVGDRSAEIRNLFMTGFAESATAEARGSAQDEAVSAMNRLTGDVVRARTSLNTLDSLTATLEAQRSNLESLTNRLGINSRQAALNSVSTPRAVTGSEVNNNSETASLAQSAAQISRNTTPVQNPTQTAQVTVVNTATNATSTTPATNIAGTTAAVTPSCSSANQNEAVNSPAVLTSAPQPPVTPAAVTTLLEMGFSEPDARTAARLYPNNTQQAVEACIMGTLNATEIARTIALMTASLQIPVQSSNAQTSNAQTSNAQTSNAQSSNAQISNTQNAATTPQNTISTPQVTNVANSEHLLPAISTENETNAQATENNTESQANNETTQNDDESGEFIDDEEIDDGSENEENEENGENGENDANDANDENQESGEIEAELTEAQMQAISELDNQVIRTQEVAHESESSEQEDSDSSYDDAMDTEENTENNPENGALSSLNHIITNPLVDEMHESSPFMLTSEQNLMTPRSPRDPSYYKQLDIISFEERVIRGKTMATELELYVTTFKEALFNLDDVQVDSEQKNLWNFVLADLLDRRPMLVEKISVMIMEQGNRHGIDWAGGIIKDLITECKNLIEDVENKSSHKLPPKLHTRLILLTIFSENPKLAVPTNQQIEEIGLLNSMISKINTSKTSPKWLAAGLMLIENYQKQQVFNKRMDLFKAFIETKTPVWQVLEAKARKWSPLTATENQEITDAFVQGNSEYKLVKSNEAQFNPAQPVIVRFKNMVVEGSQGPTDRYRAHSALENKIL